jgi:hypothetical protein
LPLIAGAIAAAALIAVGIAGYKAGWLEPKRTYTQAELNLTQITNNSAEDPIYTAAISPDGKYLAFADLGGLHLRALSSGDTQSLPIPNEFCFR